MHLSTVINFNLSMHAYDTYYWDFQTRVGWKNFIAMSHMNRHLSLPIDYPYLKVVEKSFLKEKCNGST